MRSEVFRIIICEKCNGKGKVPTGSVDYKHSNDGKSIMEECPDCEGSGRLKLTTIYETFKE